MNFSTDWSVEDLRQAIEQDHDEAFNFLMQCKENYYNGVPTISDENFDMFEDWFRETYPDDAYFSFVGVNIKGANKIKHTIPMRSCDKAKIVQDVLNWLKKINCSNELLVGMPKVDGISCSIKYVNGKISYITTRGDGIIGQDITWLKDYLNIPKEIKTLSGWTDVRGEIHLSKDTKMETNNKPLRNLASGLVNRKDDKTNCEHLRFVAYQYYDSDSSNNLFSDDLILLEKLGFCIVKFIIVPAVNLDSVRENYISTWRKEWNYETDGMVFQLNNKNLYEKVNSGYEISHHNYFNIALKPDSEGKETILKVIALEVSKSGDVIPVAIVEPIILGQREVSRATLNNYSYVRSLNLGIGDRVYITLTNEVIPFFSKVIEHSSGERFTFNECPSCGNHLEINGVHLRCVNDFCPDKMIKKIISYVEKCKMDGVAESTIRALFNNGFVKYVKDLYSLETSYDDLLAMEGFGKSKVDNLLNQIEKSKKQTIVQFIARLGMEAVGERAVTNLGITSWRAFNAFQDKKYVTGNTLIEFRKNNIDTIKELYEIINPIDESMKEKSMGEKICFTGADPWGKGRKTLTTELTEMGYDVVDSVTKDTKLLLVDDITTTSSKAEKARKLNIEIKTYEAFYGEKNEK